MVILISAGPDGQPTVALEQPDDCGAFHLEARRVERNVVAAALAAAGAGTISGDDAFIERSAVERMADGRVGDDWPDRFAGMLAYADTKGWLDEHGAVQAHVEWT